MRVPLLTALVVLGLVGCKKEEPEPEPADPPRTRSAEIDVQIEDIEDPLWELGDWHIFVTDIGDNRDITGVTDCIMDGHRQTWDPAQGIFLPDLEPYDDDPPPHDTLFADAMVDCEWESTRLFEPEHLQGDSAIFLVWSVLPHSDDAPDGFSVSDVEEAHPIIPRTFFPFEIDVNFLKDGELIDFVDDLPFPRLEDLGMEDRAEGVSAVPMLTFETESLLPPDLDTAGVFRWELKILDSRRAGYNVITDIYLGEEAAGGPGYNGGVETGTTGETEG